MATTLILVVAICTTLGVLNIVNSYVAASIALVCLKYFGGSLQTQDFILVIIGAYISAYIGTSIRAKEAPYFRPEVSNDFTNPADLYKGTFLLELLVLVVFVFLPIGKLPTMHPILVSILVVLISSYRNPGKEGVIVVQLVIVVLVSSLIKRMTGDDISGAVIVGGLGSALLFQDQSLDIEDNYTETRFSFGLGISALLLILLTPGMSSALIINGFFNRTNTQKEMGIFVAAAVEGWVLHQIISGKNTGKTMLGEIVKGLTLQPVPFDWHFVGWLVLIVLVSVLVGCILGLIINYIPLPPAIQLVPLIVTGFGSGGIATIVFFYLAILLDRINEKSSGERSTSSLMLLGAIN